MVLTRRADALGNNGKGLLHEGATARTFISLSRKEEAPWTGFLLEFSRKAKTADESAQPVRYRILLTDPEAYGLSLLLQPAALPPRLRPLTHPEKHVSIAWKTCRNTFPLCGKVSKQASIEWKRVSQRRPSVHPKS